MMCKLDILNIFLYFQTASIYYIIGKFRKIYLAPLL